MPVRHFPVTEGELHALVDGHLSAYRWPAVQAWLLSHPEDAARVDSYREQNETIHALYNDVVDEEVPPRLMLDHMTRRGRAFIAMAVTASVCVFLVGSTSGWYARGFSTPVTTKALIDDPEGPHIPVKVSLPMKVVITDHTPNSSYILGKHVYDTRVVNELRVNSPVTPLPLSAKRVFYRPSE